MTKTEENRIFKEALDGYGFDEMKPEADGIFCNGCNKVHKRPIKVYTNGRVKLCKFYVIEWYNPELT